MAYVKIKNNIVIQKQTYQEDGFVKAPDDVIVGYKVDENGNFIEPAPEEKTHAQKRVFGDPSYNPVGDQLDAIWKFINQQRLNGVDLPQDTDNQLNHYLNVKAAHPKNKGSE